jgi:eukaryotic-like serine/threonine-protein kinase
MTSSPVEPGEILAGKYKVERVLGVGGMGVVLSAIHMQLEQRVALKFLLPEVLGNADIVARFAREARAAAKIQSEHVARVIDVGTLAEGSPYMVMEYLEGQDLAAVLEARGPLSIGDAVSYVLQACEALAEAHAAGIIHRDLKPANLFLAQRADRGTLVKVLDFGISKTTLGPDAKLTKTSTLVGSPLYMSPEQLTSSKSVDPRSDIWSLGVILYEFLSGCPPFIADTMPEIVAMIIGGTPPSIRDVRPDIPVELSNVIARCLERNLVARFDSVERLARALAPFGAPSAHVSVDRITRVLRSGSRPDVDSECVGGAALAATVNVPAPTTEVVSRSSRFAATDAPWQNKTDSIVVPKTSRAPLVLTATAALGLVVGIAAVVASARPTVSTASAREATLSSAVTSAPTPSSAPIASVARVAPAVLPHSSSLAVQPLVAAPLQPLTPASVRTGKSAWPRPARGEVNGRGHGNVRPTLAPSVGNANAIPVDVSAAPQANGGRTADVIAAEPEPAKDEPASSTAESVKRDPMQIDLK